MALPGPITHSLTAGPITSLGKPGASRKPSLKTTCVVEPSYSLILIHSEAFIEHQEAFDAFELWCWRRLLKVPWTARRSS